MGVVSLARDPILDRDVAIKIISPESLSPEAVERFRREARLVAKMDHPAIVGRFMISENMRVHYFLSCLLFPARVFGTFIKDGSLSLGDVIDLGIQIGDALDYSHSQGVSDRAINPKTFL